MLPLPSVPATGDINVTIYRGDRRLWDGGRVRLVLMDPFSNSAKIIVDEYLKAGTKSVLLREVPADRGQRYSLIATAKGHRDAGIYPVQPTPDGPKHTAVMLVRDDPELDLSGFSFSYLKERSAHYHAALEAGGIDEASFGNLGPIRIASALNIEAKLRETSLDGTPAVQFLKTIGVPGNDGEGIKPDRIYATVDAGMPDQVRQEIKTSRTFTELDEWANEVSHEGFPVSFKQKIPFGSLQLSFAKNAVNDTLAADIDIDLYTDIGHFGEVLRNKILDKKTDPLTVYVQLFDQRIFPLYILKA